ncbi:MAG TPA: PQQ-binding-like beta-propeller repeat protein [Streptosporangiaceae bacterium]
MFGKSSRMWLYAAGGAALLGCLSLAVPASAAPSGDWPTYLASTSRSGFNAAETIISPSTVSGLHAVWTDPSGSVSAEPVQAAGVVYYGSWDGFERAVDASTGKQLWATFLGQTAKSTCNPPSVGIASTATVGTIPVNGVPTQAVFVGGGDHTFYALDAATGSVIWKRALGTTSATFLWSSPLFFRGIIYEGVASFGDCPLIRAKIVAIRATNGAIRHTLFTAPSGCTGASVWGSPTLDPATGDIYFATGNGGTTCTEPLAVAVIQASPDLSLLSSWQVPAMDQGPDSDFGTTPTLFTAGGRPMLGIQNKNGIYYAFDRRSLGSGPVWKTRISVAGECPECGAGNISASAWDGNLLYVGGGRSVVNGTKCQGVVAALRPANGDIVWQNCLTDGPVIAAITAVPGVGFLGEGAFLKAFDTNTGRIIFSYHDSSPGSSFWGPAALSNGTVYIGNQDGNLVALRT